MSLLIPETKPAEPAADPAPAPTVTGTTTETSSGMPRFKPQTQAVLAFLFIAGWFVMQMFILTHPIDQAMRDLVMRTLGTMDMCLGTILGYYFGSSAGSDFKTQILNRLSTPTK